ncbi:bZIP transcription factor 53-like [Silene latifolia]|uniref:bZIP transcription factor 53-like n=1 Tax=Silene latifolia TaxID=37657 RepID=UPI003D777CF1
MTFSSNSDDIKKIDTFAKPTGSSGSEGGVTDDKKRRRMESNRESARRSRQRKQQHLEGLIEQLGRLKRENEEFAKKIEQFTAMFAVSDAQNAVLNKEKDRLATRLAALENVIDIARVVRGSSSSTTTAATGNGNEMNDDRMMKPWQLPRYSLPITASSSGLRCFNFDA